MQILPTLIFKTPFDPGKNPIMLVLYVDDDRSGRWWPRLGGPIERVSPVRGPDDLLAPGVDLYDLILCKAILTVPGQSDEARRGHSIMAARNPVHQLWRL